MGSVLSKKSKLKIKNVIRKGKDMQKASATILLRNKSDINVLCFDVNIEDFYLAHFRLWPQNHPNNSSTPDLSLAFSSSDGGYYLQ